MGTVILYANQAHTNLSLFLVIFIFAQVCALFVYALCGLAQPRISRFSLQVVLIVVGYVMYSFVRAFVAEKLLWRAEAVDEALLGWRFRSNLLVNLPGFVGSAWVMNARERSASHLNELLRQGDELSIELGKITDLYTEQRSYGERELSLEISSAKQLLDSIEMQSEDLAAHRLIIERLKGVVHHASQAVRAMSQNAQRQQDAMSAIPIRSTFVDVVDRVTQVRGVPPWFASLSGFFFATTYATDYNPDQSPLLRSMGIGIVLFAILWFFRHRILPRIRYWPRFQRVLVCEVVIACASLWWALTVSRGDYAATLPVALPIVSALTCVVVMNVMAFAQSVQDQRVDYSSKLELRNHEIERAIEHIRSMMALEESTWKSMFVGNISSTPTAATVMLRSIIENPNSDNVGSSLQMVIEIWESVVERLRLVT